MRKVITVELEKEGIRLDRYLTEKDVSLSRSMIQKLLEEGNVLVNDRKEKASYKVKLGDCIEIELVPPKEVKIEAQDIPLEVVYEDEDILVVNKQKGLVVHPGSGNWDGTLVNAIMAHCKESLSGIGGELRPGIVHRLDKDTSGLLIIAKHDRAHIAMAEQIKNREVKKTYIALVRGTIAENEATIDMPIGRSTKDRKKMAVTKTGKEAITHFKVIGRFITSKGSYSLLEIKIDTGRTHQIRVHMAEIGHPVIGDIVYSNGKNEFGVEGQCLHARRLEFCHPVTGERLVLEAELPAYFRDILESLEKGI